MLDTNKKLAVGMYFDQGSRSLNDNTLEVLEKNFQTVYDFLELYTHYNILQKFIWVKYIPLSIYYFMNFLFFGDLIIKKIFWDGKRQDLKIGARYLTNRPKTIYYVVKQVAKLSRFIYLAKKYRCDVIAIPDEVYGSALLSYYCYENHYTLLTNFTDFRFSFSIHTYQSGRNYRYSDRSVVADTKEDLKAQVDAGKLYINEIFDGKSSHKDYGKAYATKPVFQLSAPNQISDAVPIILIALHNVSDAPGTMDMSYMSYEDWYADICHSLRDKDCQVYVKDHPSAKTFEHSQFTNKLKVDLPSNFTFIPGSYQINITLFDVVLSCDGSIFYEAAAKGVRGINFANGNANSLTTVEPYDCTISLFEQILNMDFKNNDIEKDSVIIYNWHVRHDLKRFNVHQNINIPELKKLKRDTSYRSVYSIEKNDVIFEETTSKYL